MGRSGATLGCYDNGVTALLGYARLDDQLWKLPAA